MWKTFFVDVFLYPFDSKPNNWFSRLKLGLFVSWRSGYKDLMLRLNFLRMELGPFNVNAKKLSVLTLLLLSVFSAVAQETFDLQLTKTFPGNSTMIVEVQIRRTLASSDFTLGQTFNGVSTITLSHNNDGTGAGEMDATSAALHSNFTGQQYFISSDLSVAGQVDLGVIRGTGAFTVTSSWKSIFVVTYTLGAPTTTSDDVTIAFSGVSIKDDANAAQTPGTITGYSGEPLPVELMSFEAKMVEGEEVVNDLTVELNWITAMELDNSHFEVERSFDGQTWEMITIIDGHGTTSKTIQYTYTDKDDLRLGENEQIYYRLKQVDYSGTFSYSSIEKVFVPKRNLLWSVQLYPNPAFNKVNIVSPITFGQIQILDFTGKVIGEYEKLQELDISNLPKGTYMLRLINGNDSVTKKLFVEK